jgi:hypothetical protein
VSARHRTGVLPVENVFRHHAKIVSSRFSCRSLFHRRPVTTDPPVSVRNTLLNAMPFQNQSMITFAAGQARKMWPFVAGFGVVGYGCVVATLGITEEDKKNSGFLNPGGSH